MNKKTLFFFACQMAWLSPYAQETKKPLTWQEVPSWNYIRMNAAQPSADGNWFAYVSGPMQGDLTLTLKSTTDTSKYNYKIGGQVSPIVFNNNSQFVAFYENPNYKDIKANEKAKRPNSKKLKLVALKDTNSVTFEKVQNFNFSNDDNKWIAIRFDAEGPRPMGADAPKGSDLLLYNLVTKKSMNLGNVSDYKFNKAGNLLAYTVDANGKNGNGVFLLDLNTGLTNTIQNDQATFSKISWNREGTAFALVKSKKDKKYKSDVYSLIGVKNIKGQQADIFTYNGLDENQIAAGFGISEFTTPYWSKDLSTIFFGISKLEKAEEPKTPEKKDPTVQKDTTAVNAVANKDTIGTKPANPNRVASTASTSKKDLEKPDMIIWNWQDKRLQHAQKLQLQRDKNYNTMSAYNVNTKKFVSLADSSIKSIALAPSQKIGYGFNFEPYEYQSNLDGQRYGDLYLVDINTGEKKLVAEKLYLNASRGMYFSPNSDYLLYYQDGNYYTVNTKTLNKTNITEKIPTSFVNIFADNNVEKPATSNFGWTMDGKYVLIKDNYDLWKVSADGKTFEALTDNWKGQQLMVTYYNNNYKDDDHIDLKKDQYFSVIDDKTKKKGIAWLPANGKKMQILKLEDASFSAVQKLNNANKYYFTQETSNIAPEAYLTADKTLKSATQLTSQENLNPKYAISKGSRLISYVSDHGDTLQATLYLPANYEEGKSYPTITYIYERLTDEKNSYVTPSFPGGGFNRAMYTSNGYAVLMPDIKYKLNDPGMSAVACVVPAVKAAIKTGIVDEKNVAIHGHSWGGYQTSFLITQTDIFKAAVAGAPLTNMISMYSLVYWNSGSSNQSIFESSQGRLTSGYWDNWEAYVRNSPIYHIKEVNTPLIIMHNDKDGAVDYTQGVEYYNGLRRLNKPVVMLTYNGENHGLVKEVNRKDYAVRMMEYFDHYLKGKAAPEWWSKGVDYINLEKHLEERAF